MTNFSYLFCKVSIFDFTASKCSTTTFKYFFQKIENQELWSDAEKAMGLRIHQAAPGKYDSGGYNFQAVFE